MIEGDCMEIIITALIFGIAFYILYNNIKKKAKAECDCKSCTNNCSLYKEKKNDKKS